MEITFLGQAGLFITCRDGTTILCDPWFSPAYYASWFPFPANDHLDVSRFGSPDYLYVSHLHHDHFDPEFLEAHIAKEATVLLPDYPVEDLRKELTELGFHRFVQTENLTPLDLGGVEIAIVALTSPTDGPIGDSGLMVHDGETRIFNQNDAHPLDTAEVRRLGAFDGHFLQFSGAIWHPMTYRWPPKAKAKLVAKKRALLRERAARYADGVGAPHVFPTAGPPCFLDEPLFRLNDYEGNEEPTIFLDQMDFLAAMEARGDDRSHLLVPGSRVRLAGDSCTVEHDRPAAEIEAIFSRKLEYLRAYQERMRPRIEAERARWSAHEIDLVAAAREQLEPHLRRAHHLSAGVDGRVLMASGERAFVVDFVERTVYAWQGEKCDFRFYFEPGILEDVLAVHEVDWVNSAFLSCRFEAERDRPYTECVFHFFKALSDERLQYVEGFLAEEEDPGGSWECAGYLIQRRCPHMKADLPEFASVEDGILTCSMHGWQFELATGRCLTSPGRTLRSRPLEAGAPASDQA